MTRYELVAAAITILLAFGVARASADVVELKTGQRVEGTFKGADDTAVRIEIGGQVLMFKPEQVRAIYYGAAPASTSPAASPSPRDEALKALKGLQSVAQAGTNYRDYSPRVSDAKIMVDRYLSGADSYDSAKTPIAAGMHYYVLAGSAWSSSISRSNYERVGADPAVGECEPARHVIAESKRTLPIIWRSPVGEATTVGIVIGAGGISALWSCASDKIADAERLLSGLPAVPPLQAPREVSAEAKACWDMAGDDVALRAKCAGLFGQR